MVLDVARKFASRFGTKRRSGFKQFKKRNVMTTRTKINQGMTSTRITSVLFLSSTANDDNQMFVIPVERHLGNVWVEAAMAANPNWTNYASLYAFYSITKIKIEVIPYITAANQLIVPGKVRQLAIAYDPAGQAGLTYTRILNLDNFLVIPMSNILYPSKAERIFKFKPIAGLAPPFLTKNVTTDGTYVGNYGNIHYFKSDGWTKDLNHVQFIISYYVKFSGDI